MFQRSIVPRLRNVGTLERNGSTAPLIPTAPCVAIALLVSLLKSPPIHATHVARSIPAVIGVSILTLASRIVAITIPRIVAPLPVAVLIPLIEGLPVDPIAAVRSGS
jgi:hypothetical protein